MQRLINKKQIFNKMVERITNENLSLERNFSENATFTYHSGGNLITYPAFKNLDLLTNQFSLAHELGHHYQQQQYSAFSKTLCILSKKNRLNGVVFFPFTLYEEIDAWIKARRICNEEHISNLGFIEHAITAVFSYIKAFLLQLFFYFKMILGLYLSSVFMIRFFMISSDMDLQFHPVIEGIRREIYSSPLSQADLVHQLFTGMLSAYVSLLLVYVLFSFLTVLGKRL